MIDASSASTSVPLASPQSLLNRTVGVITRSVHLDLGDHKAGAVLDHLPAQARHQARNKQQHRIAKGDGGHSDKSTPADCARDCATQAEEGVRSCFRLGREKVSALIGTSNAISSYTIVVCCTGLSGVA